MLKDALHIFERLVAQFTIEGPQTHVCRVCCVVYFFACFVADGFLFKKCGDGRTAQAKDSNSSGDSNPGGNFFVRDARNSAVNLLERP
eukprot:SAG11_NODE_3543_length_2380_cov_1.566857_4_plen_88_part_00